MDYELKVHLTLTSTTETPEGLSSLKGLNPTRTWQVGDRIEGSIRQYSVNGWQISSQRPTGDALEDHLKSIIETLSPAKSTLVALVDRWEAEVGCAIYVYDTTPPLHVEREVLKFFADLGASIDLELYFHKNE